MAWLLLLPIILYLVLGLVYALFLVITTGMPVKEMMGVVIFGPISLFSLVSSVKKGKKVKLG